MPEDQNILYMEYDGRNVERVKYVDETDRQKIITGLRDAYEVKKGKPFLFYIVRQSSMNTNKKIKNVL